MPPTACQHPPRFAIPLRYAQAVTRYVYDEEAGRALHLDVVHEMDERAPMSATLWIEAIRRLNVIEDPLIRRILAVHLDCGSGTGACDDMEAEGVPLSERKRLGMRDHGAHRTALRCRLPQGPGKRLKARPTPHARLSRRSFTATTRALAEIDRPTGAATATRSTWRIGLWYLSSRT